MSISAELLNVSKDYDGCRANSDVSLHVRAGTIHALVGENGAGKSTAMKILFGMVKPDSGAVRFNGKDVTKHWSPQTAFQYGIGMVHQHFMLAGPETVLDNLVLGAETTRWGIRDRKAERKAIEALMQSTGLDVPMDIRTESLPIGLQSRCEILKVLYRKARFLILDEPTAVLTPQEIEGLLQTLRVLRDQGHTILIVTHKLREVTAVADDATILRAGATIATRKVSESSAEELSELMVGRRLQMPKAGADSSRQRAPRFEVKTADFHLSLKPGQIVGIAGVEGNGQEKLIAKITEDLGSLRDKPIALIPSDRHKEGLVLPFSLLENLRLGRAQKRKRGLFRFPKVSESELERFVAYDIRPNNPELPARALSGGNQQKLIAAREIGLLNENELAQSVIFAMHPTRGVDLGAIELIHGKILSAANRGAAVLIISSELAELMALSHRIGVFHRGKIERWFDGPTYDEKKIGLAMLVGTSTVDEATA